MKVLVANLGSTSFKYRLFDMTDERQIARGGIERIWTEGVPVRDALAELAAAVRGLLRIDRELVFPTAD